MQARNTTKGTRRLLQTKMWQRVSKHENEDRAALLTPKHEMKIGQPSSPKIMKMKIRQPSSPKKTCAGWMNVQADIPEASCSHQVQTELKNHKKCSCIPIWSPQLYFKALLSRYAGTISDSSLGSSQSADVLSWDISIRWLVGQAGGDPAQVLHKHMQSKHRKSFQTARHMFPAWAGGVAVQG